MLERNVLNQTLRIQLQTKEFLERNQPGQAQLYNTDFIGDIGTLKTFQPYQPNLQRALIDNFVEKPESALFRHIVPLSLAISSKSEDFRPSVQERPTIISSAQFAVLEPKEK